MKKNIKQIYSNKISFIIILLSTFLFFVLFSVSSYESVLRFNQYNFYSSFDYIAESSNKLTDSSYINLTNETTVHINNHSEFGECHCIVHSCKLMQNKDYDSKDKLNPFEISISKNLAIKNKLNVGDTLYLFIDNSGFAKPFVIKTITEYNYGLRDVDFNNLSGLVVLGYTNHTQFYNYQYITFLTKQEKAELSINMNYKLFDISTEKNTLIFLTIIIPCLSSFFTSLITMVEYHAFSGDYFKKIISRKMKGEKLLILKQDIFKSMLPLFVVSLIANFSSLITSLVTANFAYILIFTINVIAITIGFFISFFLETKREKVFK